MINNRFISLSILILFISPIYSQVDPEKYPCKSLAEFNKLDFWLGEWDVFTQNGEKVGENRIEKILSDCAIMEQWVGNDGSQGKSLFYFDTVNKRWTQIWITENTMRPGGLKQKYLVTDFGDETHVRFQGQYFDGKGRIILDRTTLIKMNDGNIRQIIETSKDKGVNWRIGFDALYQPKMPNK